MEKIIDNYVHQLSNLVESIVFILHYQLVKINKKFFLFEHFFSSEEPCMKRNKYIPTPSAVIFLSIFYNGSTVGGYSRTIRRILLREIQVFIFFSKNYFYLFYFSKHKKVFIFD